MDSSDESEIDCTSRQIEEADPYKLEVLSKQSKKRYEREYSLFVEWCDRNKLGSCHSENVLLAYVSEISKKRKPSTMWSIHTMLRTTLAAHLNVDISKYNRLFTFLKKYSKDYNPIKSKILKKEEIDRFLLDASDEQYLMLKVALVFGVYGALRRDELTNMLVDDIYDNGSTLVVQVPNINPDGVPRTFIVSNSAEQKLDYLSFYRKYVALRPSRVTTRRFFLKFRNGKCESRVVGMNSFGKIPKQIAEILNLPDPALYTGNCFRRSHASFLEDADRCKSVQSFSYYY